MLTVDCEVMVYGWMEHLQSLVSCLDNYCLYMRLSRQTLSSNRYHCRHRGRGHAAATRQGLSPDTAIAFQGRLWIKLHNTAVAVHATCSADAFELLLQYFFTLNVCYPSELWLVYGSWA